MTSFNHTSEHTWSSRKKVALAMSSHNLSICRSLDNGVDVSDTIDGRCLAYLKGMVAHSWDSNRTYNDLYLVCDSHKYSCGDITRHLEKDYPISFFPHAKSMFDHTTNAWCKKLKIYCSPLGVGPILNLKYIYDTFILVWLQVTREIWVFNINMIEYT